MILEAAIALLTLTALEVILGIDNILVISILTERLPETQQPKARLIGQALAMILRIVLLLFINQITQMKTVLFTIVGHGFSGKHLILLGGGMFLLVKAVLEIHKHVEGLEESKTKSGKTESFAWIITQILLLDLVFSLDSVITAVGMVEPDQLWIMITAIVISVILMMFFAGPISRFVQRHSTMKVLALSFLVLIAVTLVMEGWGEHISKGYLYFAMSFALIVELLNLRAWKKVASKQPTGFADSTQ